MDLSNQALKPLRPLAEAELREWEEAYAAVEAYLLALRVRNRILLADLVRGILFRAAERKEAEPGRTPRELAMEETLGEIARWTHEVLEEDAEDAQLSLRGRLALLLADMPNRWQGVFLTPAPWPEEFLRAMRSSYLAAGPEMRGLRMEPHPLELNPLGTGAAQWSELLDRRPYLRVAMVALALAVMGLIGWSIFLD